MPIPRLPATHHMTMQTISAFQVKKKTAPRAHRCRAIMIAVTPQFTDEEKVLSCFSEENRLIITFYCSIIGCAFVGNRKGKRAKSIRVIFGADSRILGERGREHSFPRGGAGGEHLRAAPRVAAGRWRRARGAEPPRLVHPACAGFDDSCLHPV